MPHLLPGLAAIAKLPEVNQSQLRNKLAVELLLLMEEAAPRKKCFFT